MHFTPTLVDQEPTAHDSTNSTSQSWPTDKCECAKVYG